jgi:hypothetical protein
MWPLFLSGVLVREEAGSKSVVVCKSIPASTTFIHGQVSINGCFKTSKLHLSREKLAFSLVHKCEVMTCYYDIVTLRYSSDAILRTAELEQVKVSPKSAHHGLSAQARPVEKRTFDTISFLCLCILILMLIRTLQPRAL